MNEVAQRVITVEEALWLQYDAINAFQLLCEIEDWLGKVCRKDFDYGWNHFALQHGDRSELINEAQRRGFDAAVANYDEDCAEDAAMRLEMEERF